MPLAAQHARLSVLVGAAMAYGGDEMNRSKYVALFAADIDPRMPAAAYLDGAENENELSQLIGEVGASLSRARVRACVTCCNAARHGATQRSTVQRSEARCNAAKHVAT